MAEDRALENIKRKAENLFKHFPCRFLKILSVEKIESPSTPTAVGICIKYKTPEEENSLITLFKKSELKKEGDCIKRCICELKERVPEKYSALDITNVRELSNTFLERFSLKNELDCFTISGVPYRQLCILLPSGKFFLDVSKVTYQKLLTRFSQEKFWPANMGFESFSNLLKRKEMVTLCIRLAQKDD